MNLLHRVLVSGTTHAVASDWLLEEESIMSISGGMTLRLEKRVEVPERTLDKAIRRHLRETHFEEDFFELLTDEEKRMKVTTRERHASSIEVVLLEGLVLPGTGAHHLRSQFSLHLDSLSREVATLSDLITFDTLDSEMLSLLIRIEYLLVVLIGDRVIQKCVEVLLVLIDGRLGDSLVVGTILLNPFLLHGFTLTDLSNWSTNSLLHISHADLLAHFHGGDELELRRTI